MYKEQHCCTKKQLEMIEAAEKTAKAGIKKAQEVLRNDFQQNNVEERYMQDLLIRYASEGRPILMSFYRWYWELMQISSEIIKGFDDNNYGVECETSCDEGVTAYVASSWVISIGLDNDIHFCPSYFKMSKDRQAEKFLHEASHFFANTEDLSLGGTEPFWKNARDAYWVESLATSQYDFMDRFMKGFVKFWDRKSGMGN
jgi:hypothetical protein